MAALWRPCGRGLQEGAHEPLAEQPRGREDISPALRRRGATAPGSRTEKEEMEPAEKTGTPEVSGGLGHAVHVGVVTKRRSPRV